MYCLDDLRWSVCSTVRAVPAAWWTWETLRWRATTVTQCTTVGLWLLFASSCLPFQSWTDQFCCVCCEVMCNSTSLHRRLRRARIMLTFWTVCLSLKGIVCVRMTRARLDPRVANTRVCRVLCKLQIGSPKTANPSWPLLHFIRTYVLLSKELTEGFRLYLILAHPVSRKCIL